MPSTADCYNLLLSREVRKHFIKLLITKADKTIEQQSWTHNKELEQMFKYIYGIDKSVAQISDLCLTKEPEDVIKDIQVISKRRN